MSTAPVRASLLESLKGLIERTYGFTADIDDVGRFVVGDEGYRRLVAERRVVRRVGDASAGAATLVRRDGRGRLHLSVYYPDALIARLEACDPRAALDERNVVDFSVLTEELDHLLMLVRRARAGMTTTLLELELHANVTKYLTVLFFLGKHGGGARPGTAARVWARRQLFHAAEYDADDDRVRMRYEDARKLAVRYLERLEELPQRTRVAALRRWSAAPWQEKLHEIGRR